MENVLNAVRKRNSPVQTHDAAQSAQHLVQGIAFHNPVVVFMSSNAADTENPTTQLLIDLLHSLKISFKDVDVTADPTMSLGLPQKDGVVDLPYLYLAGLAIGGPDKVLEMAQSGALIECLDKSKISYDPIVAKGLVKTS